MPKLEVFSNYSQNTALANDIPKIRLISILGDIMRNSPNYSFKAIVLDSEFYDLCKCYLIQKYCYDEDLYLLDDHRFEVIYRDEIREAYRILNADRTRLSRLRKRVEFLLCTQPCLFLTLTFRDEVLKNTDSSTRRQYVVRYLKSNTNFYIANIDFGEEYGREHYHAIVAKDKIDGSEWRKKCGSINFERCGGVEDAIAIAKYTAKLTNHAIKSTTHRSALIYSRNFNDLLVSKVLDHPAIYEHKKKQYWSRKLDKRLRRVEYDMWKAKCQQLELE